MKILYLAHRIPYPPDKGDKIRSFHMLKHLAKRHDVWCACFVDDPADAKHVTTLRQYCAEVIALPLNRRRATLRGLFDLAIDETATEGFYRERAMADALQQLSRRVRFDTVFTFSSSMGQYAWCVDAPRRVIDFCDLDSRKWMEMSTRCAPPKSWLLKAEGRRLAQLETKLHDAFDASILIGSHEAERWDVQDRDKLHFLGNGVNLPELDSATTPESATVGFVGDMGYFPNQDAVSFFAREVWPDILSVIPDAHFEIIGRNPSRGVRRLGRLEGVEVVGAVPDVLPRLQRLAVVVAPLRIARGIQNKVLESLAAAKPTVVTPAAATGLEIVDGEHAMIADCPETFAAQVNRLLRDSQLAAALGSRGREMVANRYSWGRQLATLDALLTHPPQAAATANRSSEVSELPSLV